jgi:hypothetical protein
VRSDSVPRPLWRRRRASDESRPIQAVGAGVTQVINRGTLVERDDKVWLREWAKDPPFHNDGQSSVS